MFAGLCADRRCRGPEPDCRRSSAALTAHTPQRHHPSHTPARADCRRRGARTYRAQYSYGSAPQPGLVLPAQRAVLEGRGLVRRRSTLRHWLCSPGSSSNLQRAARSRKRSAVSGSLPRRSAPASALPRPRGGNPRNGLSPPLHITTSPSAGTILRTPVGPMLMPRGTAAHTVGLTAVSTARRNSRTGRQDSTAQGSTTS